MFETDLTDKELEMAIKAFGLLSSKGVGDDELLQFIGDQLGYDDTVIYLALASVGMYII